MSESNGLPCIFTVCVRLLILHGDGTDGRDYTDFRTGGVWVVFGGILGGLSGLKVCKKSRKKKFKIVNKLFQSLLNAFKHHLKVLKGQMNHPDFLIRFLARVLTRVWERGKTVNTVYSTTWAKEKHPKTIENIKKL